MEALKGRRKAITYGKTNKRLPVHNIFNGSPETIGRNSVNSPSWPPKPGTQAVAKRGTEETSQQTSTSESQRQLSGGSYDVLLSGSDSYEESDASLSNHAILSKSHSASPSLFDVGSSDDESPAHHGSTSIRKKRKLAPPSTLNESTRGPQDSRRAYQPQAHKGQLPSRDRAHSSEKNWSALSDQRVAASQRSKAQLKTFNRTKPISRQSKIVSNPRPHAEISTADEGSFSSRPTTPVSVDSPESPRQGGNKLSSAENSVPPAKAPSAVQRTPKTKNLSHARETLNEAISSPSQLGLRSLRLAPDKLPAPIDATTAATDIYPTQLTPRRGRQRLVDRLDSPRRASRSSDTRSLRGAVEESAPHDVREDGNETYRITSREPSLHRAPPGKKILDVEKNHETGAQLPPVNLNRTYAKERSHLSDMVIEDSDILLPPASHGSASQAASQDSTYSSLKSHLELDDSDSDVEETGANVRSIHELRQAGANNRFERELETLFEDIEPQSNSSKALRLQALMQLVTKLNDEVFSRRFVEAGMVARLTAAAQAGLDILGAVFITFAFALIGQADKASRNAFKQMLHTVHGLVNLLMGEKRSLHKIAKDPKENFSKSLIREISIFEANMLSNAMWDHHRPSELTAQIVISQAFAVVILRLQLLGEVKISMPATTFHELLLVLSDCSRQLRGSQDCRDALLMIEFATSALERCRLSREVLEEEEDHEDHVLLGQALTRILSYAGEHNSALEQATLRILVNLCNNKSSLSRSLASTTVVDAALGVVKSNFLPLADSADQGEDFDKPKLDSVILALGCLLNLVDCSAVARRKMIESGSSPASPVDWLAATFHQQAGKATEATTIDQSQVLVAFGYLSMLLCSLCLDDIVRASVMARLSGGSIRELCLTGDIFLVHLKKIEGINPNDQDMSAFTEHLGGILDAVKQYTA